MPRDKGQPLSFEDAPQMERRSLASAFCAQSTKCKFESSVGPLLLRATLEPLREHLDLEGRTGADGVQGLLVGTGKAQVRGLP